MLKFKWYFSVTLSAGYIIMCIKKVTVFMNYSSKLLVKRFVQKKTI